MTARREVIGNAELWLGDCREILPQISGISAVVTDPPYGMEFMGKGWDKAVPGLDFWAPVLTSCLPGAHLLAFGGTRTYHRMAVAIEDAGFEIRDNIMWMYGTGYPKSHDVAKGIDKMLGTPGEVIPQGAPVKRMIPGADQDRTGLWIKDNGREFQPGAYVPGSPEAAQWDGWGTALKPAFEPIVLARKPMVGTVAANVLAYGTGALNIDACRVQGPGVLRSTGSGKRDRDDGYRMQGGVIGGSELGRWPANVIHDGSDEVLEAFAAYGERGAAAPVKGTEASAASAGRVTGERARVPGVFHADTGTAARFFYSAKATAADRAGSKHPTVKPLALMRYLCKLVTPPGGTVLDPFMGSGSTGVAAVMEGARFIGCELDPAYFADACRRIEAAQRQGSLFTMDVAE